MILYKAYVIEGDKCSHNNPTMKRVVFLLVSFAACQAQYGGIYTKLKDCLGSANPVVCLKEEALHAINETIYSDQPITLYEMVDIVRDPKYSPNDTGEALPEDADLRSVKLNELLYDKIDEFVSSRTVQLNLNSVIEGKWFHLHITITAFVTQHEPVPSNLLLFSILHIPSVLSNLAMCKQTSI